MSLPERASEREDCGESAPELAVRPFRFPLLLEICNAAGAAETASDGGRE